MRATHKRLEPRHLRRLLSIGLLAVMTACGGGGGGSGTEPPPPVTAPPVPLGPPVTATIGAAGGTLDVAAGALSAQVSVPAGAVAGETAFSVTAYTPAAGEQMRLRITPAGVALAKPVVLSVVLPAGSPPDASAAWTWVSGTVATALPSQVDAGKHRVEARFSYLPAASVQQALRVSRRTAPPNEPAELSLRNTTIQQRVAQAERALQALKRAHQFGEAFELQVSVAMLLQSSGLDGYAAAATPWLDGAMQSACGELYAAMTAAQGTRIATQGDFRRLASRLLYWHSTVQKLGRGECAGAGGAVVTALYSELIDKAVLREKELLRQNASHGQVAAEAQEPADGQRLTGEALLLNDEAAAQRFKTEHVEKLLQPFREAAWAGAAQGITQQHYQQVLDGFGPGSQFTQDARYVIGTDSIKTDAQYVLTEMNLAGFDRSGQQRAGRSHILAAHDARPLAQTGSARLGRGSGPGEQIAQATLAMETDGSLEIAGDIGVLRCPTPASERLIVSFEGHVVSDTGATENRHLGSALRLQASTLLTAAGIEPPNARQHTLTVRRVGSSCNAAFGDGDRTLATVTLDFAPERQWKPSETLATAPVIEGYRAVVDGGGNLTVFWVARNINGSAQRLLARRWDKDSAAWSEEETLASGGSGVTLGGAEADDAGHVHVLWRQTQGSGDSVVTTVRTSRRDAASGLWDADVVLDSAAGLLGAQSTQLAVSPNGDAFAAWSRRAGILLQLSAVRFSAATKLWGAPAELTSAADDSLGFKLAAGGAGDALLAVQETLRIEQPNAVLYPIRLRTLHYHAQAGSWSAPLTHVEPVTGREPALAGVRMARNGDALVYWRRAVLSGGVPRRLTPMASSYRAATDSWSLAEAVAPEGAENVGWLDPRPSYGGIDAQGQALLLLVEAPSGQLPIYRRPAGGSWQRVGTALPPGVAGTLLVDDPGNALVDLQVTGAGSRAMRLDAGANAWVQQETEAVSNPGFVPSIAGNRSGNRLLRLWVVPGTAASPLQTLRVQAWR